MPIQHQIDTKANCVHIRHTGTFDAREFEEYFGVLITDPEFLPSMNFIQDLRQCDIPDEIDYSVISSELRDIASRIDSNLSACHMAIVAKNPQDYAKVHQFIVALRFAKTSVERRAFRDMDKAREWIGLPKDYEIKFPSDD